MDAVKRYLINAVTMFLVSWLSLVLLVYVGYGEAQRTYHQFLFDKLVGQGKIVQNALETFLRDGLPMKQYVGFNMLVEPIMASDKSIVSVVAMDRSERRVFTSGDPSIPLLQADSIESASTERSLDLRESKTHFQVVLPLRNKFEQVGNLAISMPRSGVNQRLDYRFKLLFEVATGLSVAFAFFASLVLPLLKKRRMPWLQVVYAVTFLCMATAVVTTLVSLYSEGAQSKTKALADSLGQRLGDIVHFNLNIKDFDGLDKTFGNYRRLNPDIRAAGLTIDGKVLIHTDPKAVGKPWVSENGAYEYVVDLTAARKDAHDIKVAVVLPAEIVYRQVARSVKNFAVLFVASAFMAGLFLQLAGTMQHVRLTGPATNVFGPPTKYDEAMLSIVKPVFFVAVFFEHLAYSFLPQFMHQVAATHGLWPNFASTTYMIYYLCFALALIPAGTYSQQHGPRRLIMGGLLLSAVGLLTLALPDAVYLLMGARAISGIGQGMLFIGIQSYILAVASPEKRTQGAAIIVFGFQGGMISGTAIGALLVVYMGPDGVFTFGAIIALAMALYAMVLVPEVVPIKRDGFGLRQTVKQLGSNVGMAIRSFDFMKTMLLVGIPAKAVMTGIIMFALPLLLARMEYAQEDIGQIIMLYGAGVLVASSYISRFVDRTGKAEYVLFMGTLISGVGVFMISVMEWQGFGNLPGGNTLVIIAGVVTLGLAHGLINAPVVTHVAESKLASRIGTDSTTASYRFLERIGHVAGPIIVGQMFLVGGQQTGSLIWIAVAVIVFGLVFLVRSNRAELNPAYKG